MTIAGFLFEHDLFGKPLHTFPDHALEGTQMLYAILAYHVETEVTSWNAEEDAELMVNLRKAHDRLNAIGRLGPAARLDVTGKAKTLRSGTLIDGPFAETKEQLLGLYVADFPGRSRSL
jgi:hypothetical protein